MVIYDANTHFVSMVCCVVVEYVCGVFVSVCKRCGVVCLCKVCVQGDRVSV